MKVMTCKLGHNLDACCSRLAIIQENNYGHPSSVTYDEVR